MVSMKKMFAAAALAASLTTHGTEETMQQVLNTWQQQVSAYEEAIKAAENDEMRATIPPRMLVI